MKSNFFQRVKKAYNAYTGRFTSLDPDGFPVWSSPTSAGLSINAERALYATAVFSCVNLLSSVIASLPLKLYKKETDGDVLEAQANPLYWILSYMPNKFQTAYEYWLYNMECILLRGGFISWVIARRTEKFFNLYRSILIPLPVNFPQPGKFLYPVSLNGDRTAICSSTNRRRKISSGQTTGRLTDSIQRPR
jgi:phage portal protein BeeE